MTQFAYVGKTPGDLLGGYFGFTFGDNPKTPNLNTGARLGPAFLFPDNHIEFTWTLPCSRIPELDAVLNGAEYMWAVGVTEYEDRFGGLHEGGYAKRLSEDRRNFVFSLETGPFNYDRPMQPQIRKNYGRS